MGRIFVVASGKGGCGTTSAALVFAAYAAGTGKRVLLVDGDVGGRTLTYLAAAEELLLYDMGDAAAGRCALDEAWYASPAYAGVWVLPAPLREEEAPPAVGMAGLLRRCAAYFDEVIVDLPVHSPWLQAVCAAADEMAVCSAPDPLSVRACGLLREKLTFSGEARLVITGFSLPDMQALCGSHDLDAVIDGVGLRLLGVVPWDSAFARYTMARNRKGTDTNAWAALCRCCARLHGEEIPLNGKDFI